MTRVLRQTPDELVIEDRPWLFGLTFVGMVVLGAWLQFEAWDERSIGLSLTGLAIAALGLFAMKKVTRISRLTIAGDTVTFSTHDAAGWRHRSWPCATVSAAVETHRDSDGDTHRAVLLIRGGAATERVPFTPYLSSAEDTARTTVDLIRARCAG